MHRRALAWPTATAWSGRAGLGSQPAPTCIANAELSIRNRRGQTQAPVAIAIPTSRWGRDPFVGGTPPSWTRNPPGRAWDQQCPEVSWPTLWADRVLLLDAVDGVLLAAHCQMRSPEMRTLRTYLMVGVGFQGV